MFDPQKGMTKIDGFCVYDAIVLTNIIDKLLKTGAVLGREVSHVAALRAKTLACVEKAVGINLDQYE